ncbi:glucokinase [Evansella vedderi]|uniref:Glucokinase n=1 Tax=Evansella vedderi TaxID=38282 RepID=A0ABT9ZXW2_9BACI|nr:ROK family protein [Evansella vedderi]MDQ0256079.1 glucokinase [Evansella vedderi]
MYRIGIDIGGTNMRVGIFDDGGNLVVKEKILTNAQEGATVAIKRLKLLINEVLNSKEVDKTQKIKGIGVGSPGPLDPWKGEIQSPPNLPGWDNIPLRQNLQDKYNLPVFLHNDANAAALGEFLYAYNKEVKNLVYITVSTGIGGGIISDGKLMLGDKGSAGEVGHIIIRPDGNMCSCGNRGCLEAQASGTGIFTRTQEALKNYDRPTILKNFDLLSSKEIIEAANLGDSFAKHIIEEVQMDLALGIVNIAHAYNPQKIVFGGGVMQSGDTFIQPVIERAREMILPSMAENLDFSVTKLGGDLGLFGAAALVDYFQD